MRGELFLVIINKIHNTQTNLCITFAQNALASLKNLVFARQKDVNIKANHFSHAPAMTERTKKCLIPKKRNLQRPKYRYQKTSAVIALVFWFIKN